jgi:hypothetical protein
MENTKDFQVVSLNTKKDRVFALNNQLAIGEEIIPETIRRGVSQ